MQGSHIRHQFNLHGRKIVVIASLFLFLATAGHAQVKRTNRWVQKNNPNYDDKKLTYGFLIGLHTTSYQIKYSDKFVTPQFDTAYAVVPSWKPGFALGFIVNYRLTEFLDVRLTPTVGFYENKVTYYFTNDTKTLDQNVASTMVEFPVLLKYKSERRGNVRMYMIGGVKPAIEASGKKDVEETVLEVKNSNLSLEAGVGFDLYYPLFKFSPEIRFSRGIVNMLDNTTNRFGQPLQRVNTNTVTIFFLFQ